MSSSYKNALRLDVKLPPQGARWSDIRESVRYIDSVPEIDGIWLFDHLASVRTGPNGQEAPLSIFDGWTLLASIASITTRVRLGLMVASALYRNIGVLANTISSIDEISQGRLDLGLGAGNNEREAAAYGVPFGLPSRRIRLLEETVSGLWELWRSATPVTVKGNEVHLDSALLVMKPLNGSVPLWIGGKGEQKMLRLVAQYADYWNFSNGSYEEFNEKLSILRQYATAFGRVCPTPSVQVQTHRSVSDSLEKVTRFYELGARHFLLYTLPNPDALAVAVGVSEAFKSAIN